MKKKKTKRRKYSMMVNKAILHILDFNSGISVFSQKELDFSDISTTNYIEKHIKRIDADSNKKSGIFQKDSSLYGILQKYLLNKIDFIELSIYIGNILYEQILRSDRLESSDLLVTEYFENNNRYLAILLLATKEAYTHHVAQSGDTIYNELIRHNAILPNVSQKVDSYAIINLNDYYIDYSDKRRFIDGKDCFVIPNILLQCSQGVSSKETVSMLSKIAIEVAEEYGLNPTVAVSRTKTFLIENAELSEKLLPNEIGREIFSDSEEMQEAFERSVAQLNLPKEVKINRNLAVRTGKSQKIRTDTGIEISFPAEYFQNNEYIEIINNPNGTISIELKNIGKIINK